MIRALDRALDVAIRRAGTPAGVRFTERQLYYEMCRVLRPLHAAPRLPPFTLPPPIRYGTFRAALARRGREQVPGLLPPAAPPHTTTGPVSTEPDLFDYGLPRMLICQHRAIASMLRANDLHMEAASPILAVDDLPPDPRLPAALGRAGGATVYVLHDAGATGMAIPRLVRRRLAPPDGVRVVPLGLSPRQAASLHLTTLHLTTGRGPSPGGRFAEVAAVRPARLLRTLHRLMREDDPADHAPRFRDELRKARDTGFMTQPPS
ncbi:hypothetical protein OHR68_02555 [Spirillospora sp. NBC_00431]